VRRAELAEPVIQLAGIRRTFSLGDVQVQALRGVDLTIRHGEFVAIMGSSGSGKSTLMNIIGCLDPPSDGRYTLEGADVAGLAEPALARVRSQRIGFVFQSYNLLARTSALENVMLPLLYGSAVTMRPSERVQRARDVLARLGLAERESSTPSQLSGGQQQRVALARALINHPAILLADEPTGNLDSKTSHEIMELIRALNREQGVTVIVVTHEQDIAAYADRNIVMRDGQIVSDEVNPHPSGDGMPSTTASGPADPPLPSGDGGSACRSCR
jgi:macrolide transport system ATP-binding/permease protein